MCFEPLNELMLVRKNFLTLFLCPEKIFMSGKMPPPPLRARISKKKKLATQAKNFEKMIVHVGNGPPPPPHHFSNGPSLTYSV